jgi:hypothetical protein
MAAAALACGNTHKAIPCAAINRARATPRANDRFDAACGGSSKHASPAIVGKAPRFASFRDADGSFPPSAG